MFVTEILQFFKISLEYSKLIFFMIKYNTRVIYIDWGDKNCG